MQQTTFKAHCYAPNSAYSEAVDVVVSTNGQLSFEFKAQREQQFFDKTTISTRLGNTARFIDLTNGMRLETTENDVIDVLIRHWTASSSTGLWLHRIEKNIQWVITFVLVIAVTVGVTYRYGIPLLAKTVSPMVPAPMREQASLQALAQMDAFMLEETQLFSWEQTYYRELLAVELQPLVPNPLDLQFRYSDEMGANAFALPNGTIVFTDQLLGVLNDEEFLAIAAHEAGHVTEDHGMRSVISSVSLALALTLLTGDSEAISELMVTAPTLLMQLSYSRDLETEADDVALQYMAQANLPFESFASAMEKILDYHGLEDEDDDGDDD